MSDTMFNIVKGKWRYYCELPALTDALVITLFRNSGLQADDVLNNYADLGSIKASNTEASFTNYARKILTSGVTITQDNTTNKVSVDIADQTWSAATADANALGAVIVCYRPDSTSTDSQMIPLFKFGVTATPNGSDLIAQINVGGLADAT